MAPKELLFDVMGTLVYDPFYVELPRHLDLSFERLLAEKHPTAWAEFERGERDEDEFLRGFFADGRDWDSSGMKASMTGSYRLLDGIEGLLARLGAHGRRLRLVSNYPSWYRHVEEHTQLTRWADWTFVSCLEGMRKPDAAVFDLVCERLGVGAGDCLFVDDSRENVAAAAAAGMDAVHFTAAESLERELVARGVLEENDHGG